MSAKCHEQTSSRFARLAHILLSRIVEHSVGKTLGAVQTKLMVGSCEIKAVFQ